MNARTKLMTFGAYTKALELFDFVVADMALLSRYRERAVFVGLTATPRCWTDFKRIQPAVRFADLVERGILARPILIEPITGARHRLCVGPHHEPLAIRRRCARVIAT